MNFVENWRAIVWHAWSLYAIYLIAALNGIYVTISIITGALLTPPLWLALVNGVLAAATVLLRVIPQEKISGVRNGK